MAKETESKNTTASEATSQKSSRKKLLIIVPIIIILLIIVFIWFSLSSPETVRAQLIIDSGTVQVKHEGGSWTAAENGLLLAQSDSIKTGDDTVAAIILFESSIIRLDSNTEITLQELIEEDGQSSVTIEQSVGRTWNTLRNISGVENYDVQTPTTVASVRGTAFDVWVLPNGKTDVGVFRGFVRVKSVRNGEVMDTIEVRRNKTVTVDPDFIDQPLETKPTGMDDWIRRNLEKDELYTSDQQLLEQVKQDLYERIEQYIPELKATYGVTDQELDVLLEGYILGHYDLPPETPPWIRDIIELS